jgi:hypothetical protein
MVKRRFACFAVLSAATIGSALLEPTQASAAADCVTETNLYRPRAPA